MSTVYGIDEDFTEESPEQVAMDYFSYNGGDLVQVSEGESYIPTCEDEIELMESEDWDYLVKDIKPFMIYGYDHENDSVYEINIAKVKS